MAGRRGDFEVVDEAASARQTQAETAARGVAVAQCGFDVGDAGPVISREREHSESARLAANSEQELAATTVEYGVAGNFGDRDREGFDRGGVQGVGLGHLAASVSSRRDVGRFAERQTEQDFAS